MLQEVFAISDAKTQRLRHLETEIERLWSRCAELEDREASTRGHEIAMAEKLEQHHQATVVLRRKLEG